jgi:2-amino-4-hydroxy-6-hydroxymethyldihydropteridine diphosphokinase
MVADRVSAFIALGSNLGRREAHLARARSILGARRGVEIVSASRIYETDPVGGPDQGPYLNAVLGIETTLSPRSLLDQLLAIEAECGRDRGLETTRWQARNLDLDLLLYADLCLRETGLEIPHPRLHERGFVLEPLCELAPKLRHPRLGETLACYRERARDALGVQPLSRLGAWRVLP